MTIWLTGTISPGPDAIDVKTITLDVTNWIVRFEAEGKDTSGAAIRIALLAVATPFAAQRPMSSVYDTERQVRLEGTVTISSTSKSSWMPGR